MKSSESVIPSQPLPVVPATRVTKSSLLRTSLIVIIIIIMLIAGFIVWQRRKPASIHFITQPIVRQSLIQSASATGTVNAQNTILVGSQVSGIVSALYVDYNSTVKTGEILARIDPTPFQAALSQAQANFAQANAQTVVAQQAALAAQSTVGINQANASSASAQSNAVLQTARIANAAVTSAEASVRAAASAVGLAQHTIERDRTLLHQGYIAQNQFDTDQNALVADVTAFDNAQTSLQQARLQALAAQSQAHSSNALRFAALRQIAQSQALALGALASVEANKNAAQAQDALLQEAQLNLDHTVITSPVSGTVIARNVSIGQTIAASLAAPTIFSIAQDLNKMEVDIAVGEPDIGGIFDKAPLEFSVLAYPNTIFQSHVVQVRENPTTIANVVTYDVVTLIDNHDRRLRPGMTATAVIRVAQVNGALVVPLAALQWQPKNSHVTKSSLATPSASATSSNSPWGDTAVGAAGAVIAGSTAIVYVAKNEKAVGTPVRVMLVSGTQAAVLPIHGTLAVGDLAIIGSSDNTATLGATAASARGGVRL